MWHVFAAAIAAYVIPVPVGYGLMKLGLATGSDVLGGFGFMFLFSPLLSWLGLVQAFPVMFVLLRIGWGGLLPTLALGACLGVLHVLEVAAYTGSTVWRRQLVSGAIFGTIFIAIVWSWLRGRRPEGLAPSPDKPTEGRV